MSQSPLGGSIPDSSIIQSAINSMSQSANLPVFQRILTDPQAIQVSCVSVTLFN